jgi:hypothetical protein
MLDESLDILVGAWSGEPVDFVGEFYAVKDVRFMPRPIQRPSVSSGRRRLLGVACRCSERRAVTGFFQSISHIGNSWL